LEHTRPAFASLHEPAFDTTDQSKRKLLAVGVSMAAVLAVPYLIPALDQLRPWTPNDGLPLVRLMQPEEESVERGLPAWAGHGVVHGGAGRALMAKTLGTSVAAALYEEEASQGDGDGWPEDDGELALLDPAPSADESSERQPKEKRGRSPAQRAAEPDPAPAPAPEPWPEPERVGPTPRPIEDPSDKALGHFFAALARTEARQPGAVTRVIHYGDSSIAADDITHTLRRKLQQRFGDAGHGFVLAGRPHRGYRHRDVRRKSRNWRTRNVARAHLRSGRYGLGGYQFRASREDDAKSAFATARSGPVGRSVDRFEIHYQRFSKGGKLAWSLDGGPVRRLRTRGLPKEDAYHVIPVPDGRHHLAFWPGGGGQVRVYGVVMERDVPGVVYDSLGIVGARAARLLNAHPEHLARQVEHRRPDLIALGFGGNSVADDFKGFGGYKRRLRKVVQRVRAGRPEASCILLAPLDHGKRGRHSVEGSHPNVVEIVAAQREVAADTGCAFFDSFSAMGGPGSMLRWYKSTPRLASGDLVHATPRGYRVIAGFYYNALLRAYSDWRQEHPGRPAPVARAEPVLVAATEQAELAEPVIVGGVGTAVETREAGAAAFAEPVVLAETVAVAVPVPVAVAVPVPEPEPVAVAAPEPVPVPEPEPEPVAVAVAVAAGPGQPADRSPEPLPQGRPSGPRIADPDSRGLAPFFAALRRTEAGEAGAITRIAHFGDTTIVADHITHTLRKKLQGRFGDAGHGFVLAGNPDRRYYHRGIRHKSRGWSPFRVTRRELRNGRYGYGGAAFRAAGPGAKTLFGTSKRSPVGRKVGRFELYYERHRKGGILEWSLDGGRPSTINTRGEGPTDAWEVVEVPDGAHDLRLRSAGHGEVRLFGVVMERDVPGVVYDSLGLSGGRAARLLHADPRHLVAQVAHRRPDLLVFGFGREAVGDTGLSEARYKRQLARVVERVRSGRPEAGCLLVSPVDQGSKSRRAVRGTRREVIELTRWQRDVAAESGCGFFDTLEAMGGPGALRRWSARRPSLASPRFPTPAGYREVAALLYEALVAAYSDFLSDAS